MLPMPSIPMSWRNPKRRRRRWPAPDRPTRIKIMSDKIRFDADSYLSRRAANEAKLATAGVYAPDMEHDACGVGFVAARDGKPTRAVVDAAIEALQAIWHRGAVDADGM